MARIPKFLVYGKNDPQIEESIQPILPLRKWGNLELGEKRIALQELKNNMWFRYFSAEILYTIEILNRVFLRRCPGNNLHAIQPVKTDRGTNENVRRDAALSDFKNIFLNEQLDALVLRMLTEFAQQLISKRYYRQAEQEKNVQEREKYVAEAFVAFDEFVNCLNHIFDQFSVNTLLTRSGLVPKQDDKITKEIYEPTLKVLSDPKWKKVNDDLNDMFNDYVDGNYSEVITKAHSAVHRFLQIVVGEEGKSGKGEIGKLFRKAKEEGVIPVNRFTEPIIGVFQSFISSERATNSTAKPALKDASPSDAMLVMNIVMVFLQHCLQNTK